MPRQSRPRESEIGYLSSISSRTQALDDIDLFSSRADSRDVSKVDSDEEICLNSSENDGTVEFENSLPLGHSGFLFQTPHFQQR